MDMDRPQTADGGAEAEAGLVPPEAAQVIAKACADLSVSPETLAAEALNIMEQRKITSIVVVDAGRVAGVVHLHDLWRTEMI